ncbi:Type-1 restriction enzyme StySJI specificity protein [Marine Group I thaumarchaeote SCGC AAA799-P11]|uniref:Type-1 restriction enzyme StySJI specificity protein n=1 Tax=Marine Group I thaumarchaeote SCGC AAA799-P11 TaxID=1502295 RepID=A0A087RXZ6_9ARCH|nr:Type-1 restriction enzyme StySJI specificity protein [Marine Group I thaumarchaeote SCGC AAA799-P11]
MSELVLGSEKTLPNSWSFVFLNDLVTNDHDSLLRGPFGSNLKKSHFISKGFKVYEQKNVIKNDFDLGIYFVNQEKFNELEKFELKTGDMVMTCAGTIGKFAIVPNTIKKGIINSALLKIRLNKSIISEKYFLHLMQSSLIQQNIHDDARGSAMNNLKSVKSLKTIPLPIPPLDEQKRIVREIEDLFSLIENMADQIKLSHTQLDDFFRSFLKNIFSGNITKIWRESSEDSKIDKSFLEKIVSENNGKIPFKSLPEKPRNFCIPSEWTFVLSNDLFTFVTSGSRGWAKYYSDDGSLFLRVTNLNHNSISLDLKKIKRVKLSSKTEGIRTLVRENDIIVSITADGEWLL